MPIRPRERNFLQGLVADRPLSRDAGAIALWFANHHHLGTALSRRVEYQPRHFEQARDLLRNHCLPVQFLGPDALRADAAQYSGQSEKSGTVRPWANTVAVKPPAAPGGRWASPWSQPGAFEVLTVEMACQIPCERILTIENFETFRYIEHYTWLMQAMGLSTQSVMVLYRGDAITRADDANQVLRHRAEPVWTFPDFDPAGLGIAAGLPRLERVFLPPHEFLRTQAHGPRALDLFERSFSQRQATLEACEQPEIRSAWGLMKKLRAGLPQEGMRDA